MDALVISMDEPQLEQCLESVRNQIVPFSNVVHINGVIPQHRAYRKGLHEITDGWFMKIDGDMELYRNATEISLYFMSKDNSVSCHQFYLYDDFLRTSVGGCKVYKTEICKKIRLPNMLSNDRYYDKKLKKRGYGINKIPISIGVHARNPDDFQVFVRFYCIAVKYGKRLGIWSHLFKVFDQTHDPRIIFAIEVMKFGMKEGIYKGSHNRVFERQMYDKFLNERQMAGLKS